MKILMLGWELPPHNSGGLGIACYQMCKSLSKRDIDIEFILPYEADHKIDFMQVTAASSQSAPEKLQAGDAYDSHKYVHPDGRVEWRDIHTQQAVYEHAVAKLIDTKEFDVVHAHDWLTFRAALRVKELTGCPVIVHIHSVESDRAGSGHGNPLVREIEAQGLLMADRVIAISEHTKRSIMRDYEIPAEKIEVIHNSIDNVSAQPLDTTTAYRYIAAMKALGFKVVVNVGRLTVQKGLPNMLRAARKVLEKNPKTLFLFVGSGEQRNELLEISAELGIGPNVIFTEFQRGKRWRDAFAIGDLFVMPSVSEPFGLTPLEAIGYGTPVLLSRQSGVSEILKNCLKVDYWDVDEMANQMLGVLQHPELGLELWQNAYLEYQKMSWDNASHKLDRIYAQQLAGAGI